MVAPMTTQNSKSPTAVVIGSGFGGLAAAIRLSARGYRVTVLERLDSPGGRASVFRQDGFTFDAGPTIITAPFLLEELWQLAGRRLSDDVELRPVDPFYQIRFADGSVFHTCADPARMRAEVARLAPDDVEGYERFMAQSRDICRVGFEQLGHIPFDELGTMVRIIPEMMRLGSWRSVYSTAARYVKDERLRIALSFHPLFIGGNPFTVTSIYCMITYFERNWGVHFAVGGTGRLIQGMASLIEGMGGQVRCGAQVSAITVDEAARRVTGVRLASGEAIPADIVVSNADVAHTYRTLLPASVRRRWTDRRIERARYSMSLFVWYFGTRRQYPDLAHHTIVMGPRYRELLQDIFDRKVLAEDFSLYLHRPSASDPTVAPPGCDTFYVLSPVPNQGSGIDWRERAEPYRARIAAALSSSLLPGFEREIVTSKIVTPQHFQDALLSYQGAAFSLEPVLTQSAWFRPHNRSEDVEGLYLVGAGTHPGAGLPGVLSSARVLDGLIPAA